MWKVRNDKCELLDDTTNSEIVDVCGRVNHKNYSIASRWKATIFHYEPVECFVTHNKNPKTFCKATFRPAIVWVDLFTLSIDTVMI